MYGLRALKSLDVDSLTEAIQRIKISKVNVDTDSLTEAIEKTKNLIAKLEKRLATAQLLCGVERYFFRTFKSDHMKFHGNFARARFVLKLREGECLWFQGGGEGGEGEEYYVIEEGVIQDIHLAFKEVFGITEESHMQAMLDDIFKMVPGRHLDEIACLEDKTKDEVRQLARKWVIENEKNLTLLELLDTVYAKPGVGDEAYLE